MKNDTINETTILKKALSQGIINLDEVQSMVNIMERERILQQHKYDIWLASDGRWKTYLPDETKKKGRRLIAKTTKEKIENSVLEFYTQEEYDNMKSLTLRELYPVWLKYKSLKTNSTSYIRRIDQYWNKYYSNTKIIDTPIERMNKIVLEKWAYNMINKYNMTKREYYNMSIIMRQSLEYALENGDINSNPFTVVKIDKKKFRKVKKNADELEVFTEKEQADIELLAWDEYTNDKTLIAPLSVLFYFQVGLRAGELQSCKWSDIENGYLHIQRTAIVDSHKDEHGKWHDEIITRETPKSNAGERFIPLTDVALFILEQVKECNKLRNLSDSDYIFADVTPFGYISQRAIQYRLEKYCKKIGTVTKRSHKIRKTFCSTLIDSGNLNINKIREIMGHENERTTFGNYCFCRTEKEQTRENFCHAISPSTLYLGLLKDI